MALLLLLGAAALLGAPGVGLPASGAAGPPRDGFFSHSLRYFYMAVTESSPGLPHFVSVGYVDDILFVHYDADTRRTVPRVPWMEKMGEREPQYWDFNTEREQNTEAVFRRNLVTAQYHYNQSGGFHTLQEVLGCELRKDGSKGGYWQFAYDGRPYISFEKETLTWTAVDVPAQNTKQKWEAEPAIAQRQKAYLEDTCIAWLHRYLEFGKEMLLRTEPPVGKVTRKATGDGQEALICQVHGFYPREIEATWRKDGEVLDHETFRRSIAPNADGTYYAWLSIEIDPKERDLYRCHVDHASLPLVLAFEEPGVNVGAIVGAIVGTIVAAVALAVFVYVFKKCQRRRKCSEAASTNCNNSATSLIADEKPSPSPIHDVRGGEEEDTAPSHQETDESCPLHPYNCLPGCEGREKGGDEASPNLDPVLLLPGQGIGVGQPQLHLPRPRSLLSISSATALTMV